ncbi:MAG: threonine synthase [Firmicutes bacterium]|nr:threonine synthase [Bacillota bacterium]
MAWSGVIAAYRDFMPVSDLAQPVTLNEGNTPLIPSARLGERMGIRLYFKYEGANPTGSFKDRGMTVAVSRARARGAKLVVCASTGNTSASAAAYAARAGLKAAVLIPEGAVALGKLAQAVSFGATVITIRGNFDRALELAREVAATNPTLEIVNSINPYRLEGQKSAAFEIVDQLGDAPDYLAIPVGNAGNISAYWQGFKEYYAAGRSRQKPILLGFQASGAAPIVLGRPIQHPETVATAIRIGNPASWQKALAAQEESGGTIAAVSDEEILAAYRLLGKEEGIFAEPASAASVAGLLKLAKEGALRRGARVVAVLTGNGLKDPDTARRQTSEGVVVEAERGTIQQAMGL